MRLARLLLVGLLLGSGCLLGTGSASADALPLSQCTTTSGVILAVDFSHFGGGSFRSCGSTPTSGLALLQQGGWSMAGTRQYGNAFVCKIGYSGFNGGTQYPTDFSCAVTPPETSYWSYWHADVGNDSWSHSTAGASSYSPKPGSVDAWAFGAGSPPSFSPDAVRAHYVAPPPVGGGTSSHPAPPASAPAPAPAHNSPRPSTGTPSTPAQPAAASSAGASSAAARSSSARVRATILTGPSSSSTTSAASSSASTSSSATSSSNADKPGSGSGSARPAVLGGVVIVAIAALAGWQFWRRKQATKYS